MSHMSFRVKPHSIALASLAKWLSACLQTNWLWVQILNLVAVT